MKYYLAVVQNPETENETANLYAYNSENDAYALFHNELAVRGETRTGTMCKIFTDEGFIVAEEIYTKTPDTPAEAFYVFISQNQGEQSEANAVYKRDNYDDALALFHAELGYRHEARLSTMVSILTAGGNSVKDGVYRA
jgi:hypothetical protein